MENPRRPDDGSQGSRASPDGAVSGAPSVALARQARLGEALVALADNLVRGFDLLDLMQRLATTCEEVLGVDAAGIHLEDSAGGLRLVGATELHELFGVEGDEPTLEVLRSGSAVSIPDLSTSSRWPAFADRAGGVGYRSIDVVPLRLRSDVIGVLSLLGAGPRTMTLDELRIARALADMATIAVIQGRVLRDSHLLSEQLQAALDGRVIIEQAKGMLAQQGDVMVDVAFSALRGHARARRQPVADLAAAVVDGDLGWLDLRS